MSTQALEVRMARLEGAYEQIDKRLGSIDSRLLSLEQKLDRQFLWMLGLLIVAILAPLASHFTGH